MITDIQLLLKQGGIKAIWRERVKKLLSEKIDVTAFLIWFVENYPISVDLMKSNPEVMRRL